MSQTVDAKVLIHASNRDSPRHERARALVDHLSSGTRSAVLLWPTVITYLRIVTHPGIFPAPLDHDDAVANISGLLGRPEVLPGSEEAGFWATYVDTAARNDPHGDRVADVQLVALMHQHGVSTLWTADHRFRRFDGIAVLNPFSPRFKLGFTWAP